MWKIFEGGFQYQLKIDPNATSYGDLSVEALYEISEGKRFKAMCVQLVSALRCVLQYWVLGFFV